MEPTRELGFDDYLAIANRRKWRVIIPALVVPVLVYCFSLLIPNKYTSTAMVIVEQQKIPESFVRPVITEDFSERLGAMTEQVLSRSRLQSIVDKFGLQQRRRATDDNEAFLAKMRENIVITPVRSALSSRDNAPGFTISYTDRDAQIAQKVCRETVALFVSENLYAREQRAQGTTEFLQSQLDDAKRSLDEQDAKLARFKTEHIGRLPGEEETNVNVLNGLNTQLQMNSQSLHRAQQDKVYAESMLSQQLAARQTTRNGSSPQSLDADLIALQTKLTTLETRYTADHPDVVRARGEIEQLKRKIAQQNATMEGASSEQVSPRPASLAEPQQIQQLRSQIRQFEQAIADYNAEQRKLQSQVNDYQGRLQLSPTVEQRFKQLTRDYQIALDNYNDLLKKKTQSEMAAELERRQEGERFRVVDPPTLPKDPSFPNRRRLAAIGEALGIALGLGLVFLSEHRDKSLRDSTDVEDALGLRVLATVPVIASSHKV